MNLKILKAIILLSTSCFVGCAQTNNDRNLIYLPAKLKITVPADWSSTIQNSDLAVSRNFDTTGIPPKANESVLIFHSGNIENKESLTVGIFNSPNSSPADIVNKQLATIFKVNEYQPGTVSIEKESVQIDSNNATYTSVNMGQAKMANIAFKSDKYIVLLSYFYKGETEKRINELMSNVKIVN